MRLAGRAAYDRKTISRFLLAPARAAGLWAQARADKQAGSLQAAFDGATRGRGAERQVLIPVMQVAAGSSPVQSSASCSSFLTSFSASWVDQTPITG